MGKFKDNYVQHSLEYIRNTYKVPAYLGMLVEYTGGMEKKRGRIVSAKDAHLIILLDGEKNPGYYHPTWCLTYFPEDAYEDKKR